MHGHRYTESERRIDEEEAAERERERRGTFAVVTVKTGESMPTQSSVDDV